MPGKLLKTVLIFGVFLLTACEGKQEVDLPLEENKLIQILIDAHIAEGALQSSDKATKDSLSKNYYDQIFKIHGVSKEDFNDAMKVLEENPARMEALYKKLMDEIDKRRAEIGNKEEDISTPSTTQ